MAELALLRLLSWLSPAFAVSADSYTHGLEAAVENALVSDRESALSWAKGIVLQGSGRQDAWLFARAYRAAVEGDLPRLSALSELGEALRPTAELAFESRAQGEAFLSIVGRAWPEQGVEDYATLLKTSGRRAIYPIAVAVAAAAHGVKLDDALAAYLHAFVANLVTAAVRLVPLGQTDARRIMAALEQDLLDLGGDALSAFRESSAARNEWPGAATPVAERSSMIQQSEYTRLSRT
jgi:urease accessory protein